ncbi:unnamed protein product [Choristocarpus tenellus]
MKNISLRNFLVGFFCLVLSQSNNPVAYPRHGHDGDDDNLILLPAKLPPPPSLGGKGRKASRSLENGGDRNDNFQCGDLPCTEEELMDHLLRHAFNSVFDSPHHRGHEPTDNFHRKEEGAEFETARDWHMEDDVFITMESEHPPNPRTEGEWKPTAVLKVEIDPSSEEHLGSMFKTNPELGQGFGMGERDLGPDAGVDAQIDAFVQPVAPFLLGLSPISRWGETSVGDGTCVALEVEPNHEAWPQSATSSPSEEGGTGSGLGASEVAAGAGPGTLVQDKTPHRSTNVRASDVMVNYLNGLEKEVRTVTTATKEPLVDESELQCSSTMLSSQVGATVMNCDNPHDDKISWSMVGGAEGTTPNEECPGSFLVLADGEGEVKSREGCVGYSSCPLPAQEVSKNEPELGGGMPFDEESTVSSWSNEEGNYVGHLHASKEIGLDLGARIRRGDRFNKEQYLQVKDELAVEENVQYLQTTEGLQSSSISDLGVHGDESKGGEGRGSTSIVAMTDGILSESFGTQVAWGSGIFTEKDIVDRGMPVEQERLGEPSSSGKRMQVEDNKRQGLVTPPGMPPASVPFEPLGSTLACGVAAGIAVNEMHTSLQLGEKMLPGQAIVGCCEGDKCAPIVEPTKTVAVGVGTGLFWGDDKVDNMCLCHALILEADGGLVMWQLANKPNGSWGGGRISPTALWREGPAASVYDGVELVATLQEEDGRLVVAYTSLNDHLALPLWDAGVRDAVSLQVDGSSGAARLLSEGGGVLWERRPPNALEGRASGGRSAALATKALDGVLHIAWEGAALGEELARRVWVNALEPAVVVAARHIEGLAEETWRQLGQHLEDPVLA